MPDLPLSWLYGHQEAVSVLNFSKFNPSVFASGGQDGKVIMWDILKVGEEQAEIDPAEDEEEVLTESPAMMLCHEGHDHFIDDISWSPDLPYSILSVDQNMSVHMWKPAGELCGSEKGVFDPDEEIADDFVE
jgi:WD40 repeat protein